MTGRSVGRANSSPTPMSTSGRGLIKKPRPEFWAATSDLPTCAELGRRSIINTLLFGGYDRTRTAFNAYKKARAEAGLPMAGEDRFSYMAFCYVGDTDEEAFRIGQKIPWFLTVSIKSAPQMSKFQPGQIPPEMTPAAWRAGASKRPTDLSVEALIRQGQMFCGNPDTVVRQIKEFRQRVGGVGRIIMMTRSGARHPRGSDEELFAHREGSAATIAESRTGGDGRSGRGAMTSMRVGSFETGDNSRWDRSADSVDPRRQSDPRDLAIPGEAGGAW